MNRERLYPIRPGVTSEDTYVEAVRREYLQIDRAWLKLHYKISVGLVLFSFLVELMMGVFLIRSSLVTTSTELYFLKYLILPSGVNFACLLAGTLVMRSGRFSQAQKVYAVSLLLVLLCFVLFTVHTIFVATYFIFAIPIMLTVTYASYPLTGVTALASVLSMALSELFIRWDPITEHTFESTQRLSNFLIALFVLIAFSASCIVVIRIERKKNLAGVQKDIERRLLQQRVFIDELTGVYNRRAFRDELHRIEARTEQGRYMLAITDIDCFKHVNDSWGHHVGDLCLIAYAALLRDFSGGAIPFRYGGDEFCLLFPPGDMAQAEAVCREIQARTRALSFEGHPNLKLTSSFGLAENQEDVIRLFIRADRALYEAKRTRDTLHIL